MIAQVETAIEIVDKASSASDRWLFLGALAIIMVGGTACIRWLVSSLQKKDAEYALAAIAVKQTHETERADWRALMQASKAEFIGAISEQRDAFRAELSQERTQCAQERSLDRAARHEMANALQSISNVLMKYDLDFSTKKQHHEL